MSHLVPGLIFGGLGVALLWYVPRSFVRSQRTGSIRVSIRLAPAPFGGWQTLVSLLRSALHDRDEQVETSELRHRWAVYGFLGTCLLLSGVLLVTGYDYVRFGHGLSS